MTYERFEDLPVWKAALDLAVQTYALTDDQAFKGYGTLADQLERAALSVSNNIAEGFERGTTQELINFIYIARGSAGEVRSTLCFMERLPVFGNLKSEISNLKFVAEGVSRQLRGWANSLQNSDIKGQNHLSEKTSRHYQMKHDREGFLDRLQRFRDSGAKEWKSKETKPI